MHRKLLDPRKPLPPDSSKNISEKEINPLVDLAAEQFARLLWEQHLYKISHKKQPQVQG